ncbi:bile acid:sodium symporter [Leptospira sp. 96542]|nr:bile acid:sodium symporter [Leptospira sp. 96542]
MKLKIDPFVLGLLFSICIAYLFPSFGVIPELDIVVSIGVSVIFFFYGIKLKTEQLFADLKNWKLHSIIQISTFLVFPFIVILFFPFLSTERSKLFWLSFLFLASLPSTVSSSVIMVSIAKGNLTGAIFNSTISGILGIVITPIWMGFFLTKSTSEFQLTEIYFKLVLEILLPICLGLFIQIYFSKFFKNKKSRVSFFDKFIILLIVYKSFAESFAKNVFSEIHLFDVILLIFCTTILFFIMYYLIGFVCKLYKFNLEDQITAQFCGTKKSLVHGTVFSKILFSSAFPLGIILLPLMLFHAIQIFIISIIASNLAKRQSTIIIDES